MSPEVQAIEHVSILLLTLHFLILGVGICIAAALHEIKGELRKQNQAQKDGK
mgnify:CR=1 FL=1